MTFLCLFLFTSPCPILCHDPDLGPGPGPGPGPSPSPDPGPKLVPVICPGPGPWSRSRHISGLGLGPGPAIFLVLALILIPVLIKFFDPVTQCSGLLIHVSAIWLVWNVQNMALHSTIAIKRQFVYHNSMYSIYDIQSFQTNPA